MESQRDGYHHGDLRSALVSAAASLIKEGGTEAFSLREAARRVGVTANAAYRHFEDKSALLLAVAAEGFDRLAKRMQREMERAIACQKNETRALARFKAVGRAYVEFAADQPELFRVMFGAGGIECMIPPSSTKGETVKTSSAWSLLGASLDALVDEGTLAPDLRPGAELKAWTVVHGFAYLTLDGRAAMLKGKARSAALESVLEFTVRGLCGDCPDRRALPEQT